MKPHNSINIPMKDHPQRTTNIPPKNRQVPFALCHWKKNNNVCFTPINNVIPDKNKRFPIANNAASKSKRTPRITNVTPKSVNPRPISKIIKIKNMKKKILTYVLLYLIQNSSSNIIF